MAATPSKKRVIVVSLGDGTKGRVIYDGAVTFSLSRSAGL